MKEVEGEEDIEEEGDESEGDGGGGREGGGGYMADISSQVLAAVLFQTRCSSSSTNHDAASMNPADPDNAAAAHSALVKLKRSTRAAWLQARNSISPAPNQHHKPVNVFSSQVLDAHVHERSLTNVVSSERITDSATALVAELYSHNYNTVMIALRWIVVSTRTVLLLLGAAAWRPLNRRL